MSATKKDFTLQRQQSQDNDLLNYLHSQNQI